jgi:hypothetical protein
MNARRRLSWAAVWLAIVLVAIKADYLGAPAAPAPHAAWDYLRDLAAVSFVDVLYAASLWASGVTALALARDRPRDAAIAFAAVAAGTMSCSTRWPACSSSASSAGS